MDADASGPNLRHEHAPFAKGMFAFNVGASFAYAGAAFARTGPVERDTRGMADALRLEGALCRAADPGAGGARRGPLLSIRDAKWAVWGSRAAKIVGVVLMLQ